MFVLRTIGAHIEVAQIIGMRGDDADIERSRHKVIRIGNRLIYSAPLVGCQRGEILLKLHLSAAVGYILHAPPRNFIRRLILIVERDGVGRIAEGDVVAPVCTFRHGSGGLRNVI